MLVSDVIHDSKGGVSKLCREGFITPPDLVIHDLFNIILGY